jgi:tetratricopeptide (TPR) repeat protein
MLQQQDHAGEFLKKVVAMSKLTGDTASILRTVLDEEKLHPEESMVHVVKGFVLSELGDYKGASEAFDTALEINARSFWAYFHKGRMLFRQGRHEEALECFSQAVKLRPNRPDFLLAKAHAEDELARIPHAYHTYEKAILAGDKTGEAWLGKARILTYMNHNEDALDAVRMALKLRPNDEEYLAAESFIVERLSGY